MIILELFKVAAQFVPKFRCAPFAVVPDMIGRFAPPLLPSVMVATEEAIFGEFVVANPVLLASLFHDQSALPCRRSDAIRKTNQLRRVFLAKYRQIFVHRLLQSNLTVSGSVLYSILVQERAI